ncbi:MAG: dihydroorotase [Bacteroidia bacterium]|nr:dihydroorotase [Bacteroidia bacterium]
MSDNIIIRNSTLVNEGVVIESDLLIRKGRIEKIASQINAGDLNVFEFDASGLYLFPGAIDDQVHFREPGLTHKADIHSESRAAVAGGITSFMEMPNTIPNALTLEILEEKYAIAAKNSIANYSFYLGASNENYEELQKINKREICGVKIFMGSSTGNMLVDDDSALEKIFSSVDTIIATHCEDEATVRNNLIKWQEKYGDEIPFDQHPEIRSEHACWLSSSKAVSLAKKHGARLHVLHISTAKELELFDSDQKLEDKKITCEACIHHMWFTDADYEKKGGLIKWNPAVKTVFDRRAIREAVQNGEIDVVATDHAPHTIDEKKNNYVNCPSGGPLVQHSMVAMMDLFGKSKSSLPLIADKMAHSPAILFNVADRGFIREGYFADIVLIDPNTKYTVTKENLLYKCGWSPFEGHTFTTSVACTIVNGNIVYLNNSIVEGEPGTRLKFDR